MTSVDQQKIRRSRTGLIAHDPALVQPGYTLFAPMYGDGRVYLIDMDGAIAHEWRMPYRPGLYGYLLDNGHLFYSGKVMADLERFESWRRFKAGAALEVDWQGRVVWELRHPDHHHDARKLRNGNVLLLCLRSLAPEVAARVQGGLPGTEAGGTIYADYLLEMTVAGEIVWEYRDPSLFEFFSPYISGAQRLPNGNTLICEGCHGRIFEVTAGGEVVWEYVNPHFFEEPGPVGLNNWVFRAFRYTEAEI